MLLRRMQEVTGGTLLFLYDEETETVLEHMSKARTVVVSGPCYINSYPGLVIRLLEDAARRASWQGQNLYGIINGGMPYTHTHKSGVDTLEIFAEKCGFSWKGGFVLGGGAVLDGQPLEKHLFAKKVVPAYDAFVRHVAAGEFSPETLYEEAQSPPGRIFTHIMARLLSAMVTRRLKNWYDVNALAPNPKAGGEVLS